MIFERGSNQLFQNWRFWPIWMGHRPKGHLSMHVGTFFRDATKRKDNAHAPRWIRSIREASYVKTWRKKRLNEVSSMRQAWPLRLSPPPARADVHCRDISLYRSLRRLCSWGPLLERPTPGPWIHLLQGMASVSSCDVSSSDSLVLQCCGQSNFDLLR